MSASRMSRIVSDLANDPFNLSRYVSAQETIYEQVLVELRNGRGRTKWMWYIFPHIVELIYSETSRKYSLVSKEEARAYLAHPVLRGRLHECAEAVLAVEDKSAFAIFGSPGDVRLYHSMTLFAQVTGPDSVFARVLEKYFSGVQDAEELHGPLECGGVIFGPGAK